jgi:hypothetical protein
VCHEDVARMVETRTVETRTVGVKVVETKIIETKSDGSVRSPTQEKSR